MVVMVILMTHQDVALIMVIPVAFQLTETRLEALSSAHHLHRFISYSLFVNTGFIHRQRSMTIKASTSSSESFSWNFQLERDHQSFACGGLQVEVICGRYHHHDNHLIMMIIICARHNHRNGNYRHRRCHRSQKMVRPCQPINRSYCLSWSDKLHHRLQR